MNIERWIGGIDAKLQNISDKINKIEGHLEKLNDRTGDAEMDITMLKMKTEKNCTSIKSLWKRVDASKLTGKEKVAIIVAVITGVFAITVAIVQRSGL